MKIAIGISGIFRPDLYHDPVKSVLQIKEKFNGDLFCHTWEGRENEVPEIFKKNGYFFSTPEPEIDYHPIFDPESTSNPKHLFFRENKLNKDKTRYANKQIIGYCNLFDKIPKNYDLYIRTRWDVMINPYFNFEKFYDYCKYGPVGFMIRETGPNSYSLKKIEGKVVSKKKSKIDNNDWHDMLSDYLIMHRKKDIDTDKVYELHSKKNLLGAEWGWWQILSKPSGGENHTSVYGGIILVRKRKKIILDNYRFKRIFVN